MEIYNISVLSIFKIYLKITLASIYYIKLTASNIIHLNPNLKVILFQLII